jgi:xanthine dehydrogenase YagR molybdenum-binding subunit
MEMNAPIGATPLDGKPGGLVGKPIDRADGPLKVTGRAPYAYEYEGKGETAYGYVVQASIGKGRLTSIDTAAAERAPGVLLVMTWKNAPRLQPKSQKSIPELQSDAIDYYGQAVALVVAESFEQARAAAYLVKADYAREPAAHDLRDAIATARIPTGRGPADTQVGDFAGAFASAPVKVDVAYTTPHQMHAMMEPHATMAQWRGDKLILHTSNQMLNDGQQSVGATFGISPEDVRMVSRYIGGGFGNKLAVYPDAILSAMAARQLTGRRVKMAFTRQQLFHLTSHRSQTQQRVRIGTDRDGKILAIGHEAWSANLPGDDFYESAASQTRTLYAGANRMTAHRLATINLPKAASMRAPGEAVGLLALECAMDELAEKLAIDPIELRVRNEPAEDPEKHIPYSSRHLVPCMRAEAERFGWNRRKPRPGQVRDGRWLVGMGMAAATRGNSIRSSQARATLGPDGVMTVRMAMTDIGTGSYTILTQIAAEMLGLPIDKVKVLMGDTDFPKASGSGGSFGANSAGSALYDACMNLRAQLARGAGVDPAQAHFAGGLMSQDGGPSRTLVSLVGPGGMSADGQIDPGAMARQYSQQSYGAHFAEVGVDADTCEIRLRRMLGVFTIGRVLNEKTARSQMIGGMAFGIGAALMEDAVVDPRFGYFVNHDLAEYHVPVDADIGELDAVFLPELDDKASPLKAKGAGELGICGAGAAVANAVYNACGVRIRDYPLTLDKVMKGLA